MVGDIDVIFTVFEITEVIFACVFESGNIVVGVIVLDIGLVIVRNVVVDAIDVVAVFEITGVIVVDVVVSIHFLDGICLLDVVRVIDIFISVCAIVVVVTILEFTGVFVSGNNVIGDIVLSDGVVVVRYILVNAIIDCSLYFLLNLILFCCLLLYNGR